MARLIGASSVHKKVLSSIPSQGIYLGCRFDPWLGHIWKATDRSMFLSHMGILSLPLSKISKHILKWGTYVFMHIVCPEGIQPCNMKNRDFYWRRYKKLYIGQWHLSPLQSRHLGTSHSSAPSYFPKSHGWSEISSLSKMILVSGKARSRRVPNLGGSRAELPEWLDALPKNLHEMWCMSGHIVTMKLPITSCPWLPFSESSKQFPWRNVQA